MKSNTQKEKKRHKSIIIVPLTNWE